MKLIKIYLHNLVINLWYKNNLNFFFGYFIR